MTGGATLGDALATYKDEGIARLNGSRRRRAEQEAERFAAWYGLSKRTGELKPYDVESFVGTISEFSSDASDRVEALRQFLEFLHKSGQTETNLKSHAKAPRVKGKRRSTGTNQGAVVHKLTAEGHSQLTKELEALKAMRADISAAISAARADKDFRENAPLDAAREKQALNEARITEIEAVLKHVEIIDGANGAKDGIDIGSTIIVRNVGSDREQRFTLVHPREVDAKAGKISLDSPVGKALLGRAVGDKVEVQAPSGTLVLQITRVES
jgi:transcription elongation factor GreA